MSYDGGRGCGLPHPRASRRLHPPVAFPACISTRVPRHWRPGRCPPFCAPMRPRCRPIFQQLGRVAIPGPLSGGRSAIALARSRSPVAPPPAVLRRFGRATAYYVDQSMGSRHRPGTALGTGRWSPPFENCDSRPGNVISRELTSVVASVNNLECWSVTAFIS